VHVRHTPQRQVARVAAAAEHAHGAGRQRACHEGVAVDDGADAGNEDAPGSHQVDRLRHAAHRHVGKARRGLAQRLA